MFGLGGIVAGIILILLGGALVFFFPGTAKEYQTFEFGIMGIVIGFVMIILGAILIFV